ncbi:MAG: glycosyltransferase family 2 protein [Bacteroidales bacterium]|nr:glycosyltransferase family 2 protein [Bacteroidales bacterium]
MLAFLKKLLFPGRKDLSNTFEPPVSMIIPAYNEADCIDAKVQNCMELNYPQEKLQIIWVTDGSTDGSQDILKKYDGIMILHENIRKGKIHAINRCMKIVKSPFVIFSDANTMLNPEAIREIVGYFEDQKVGCVAGEKRIAGSERQKAVSAGEGLYWKYESTIKSFESETGSVLGAVGELFAVRRSLYKEVREDTLLDDFTISMQIAAAGHMIKYAPGAWSLESASFSIPEELKRKIRIATGAIQFLRREPALLNLFKYGLLSFKYISHKVLRWTLVPFGFILMLASGTAIVIIPDYSTPLFQLLLFIQFVFYLTVAAGALLKNVTLKQAFIFMPYYLFIMNYAAIAGICHYLQGKYSTNWPKAKRS